MVAMVAMAPLLPRACVDWRDYGLIRQRDALQVLAIRAGVQPRCLARGFFREESIILMSNISTKDFSDALQLCKFPTFWQPANASV
jgi:hypothetical protein